MQTGIQGKKQAKDRIFELLCVKHVLTRQDIASELGLSMPTTLQNVTDLLEIGVLRECGSAESNGGRKAQRLCLNGNAGWAIGVDIAVHHTEFAVMDLCGNVQGIRVIALPFQDDPEWYEKFRKALQQFLRDTAPAPLLGAGVSFPGTTDGSEILHSHIFRLAHMGLERFRRCIPCPAVFDNDANCACRAESRTAQDSFVYLSLNETVGGACMFNGSLVAGDTFHAGEIGHMILVPDGNRCYCGKEGCADAYLSPKALTAGAEPMEAFFDRVHAGDPTAMLQWDSYLRYLAILLTNLRMLYNTDLIIGGRVGGLIGPYMQQLLDKAAQYDLFARDIDYIYPCACREHACVTGAAKFALSCFGCRALKEMKEGGEDDEASRDF